MILKLIFRRNFLQNRINSSSLTKFGILKQNYFNFSQNEQVKEQGQTEELTIETKTSKKEKKKTKKENNYEQSVLYHKIKELEEQCSIQKEFLEQTTLKLDHMLYTYQESKEETERIKARLTKEIEQSNDYSISKMAKDILDVHDNFVRAFDSIKQKDYINAENSEKNNLYETFLEGIVMTKKSLDNIFKKYGVIEYHPIDEVYDPAKHQHELDKNHKIEKDVYVVKEVKEPGFLLKDKVIRPAKVSLVKLSMMKRFSNFMKKK